MIIDVVKILRPDALLDVGCGCGSYTLKLAPFCGQIMAVDPGELQSYWDKLPLLKKVEFINMDGRSLSFGDDVFPVSICRCALHHTLGWRRIIDQMVRVSADRVLIEEMVDDERSLGKRLFVRLEDEMLAIHKEAGYTHYRHMSPEVITAYLDRLGLDYRREIKTDDEEEDPAEWFGMLRSFAPRTKRREYWMDRIARLEEELSGQTVINPDVLFIDVKL